MHLVKIIQKMNSKRTNNVDSQLIGSTGSGSSSLEVKVFIIIDAANVMANITVQS